ncbi:MAG: nucleoside triphosphate pyrophosphohydrolase [Armatimonadetes bacterium Cent15-Ar3]|nr:MAG: nucleoside triphosphate pyrophosphohydrolase [Armatimonadetes bacterium Cent15-Ar3]
MIVLDWPSSHPIAPGAYGVGIADLLPYPGSEHIAKESTIYIPADQPFIKLSVIMDLLLGPHGCPWDREQTHASLKKYLLEEAYETIEAIDHNDPEALAEELGDLILQPVFHMRLAERTGSFEFNEPLKRITDKLIRRHPHVFGETLVADSDEVLKNWDKIKQTEKERSILAGVPQALPALARAHEVSKRAARSGFEWPDFEGVLDKVHEEVAELREAVAGGDKAHIRDEIGDLLFTIVNIARWQKIDAEDALRLMLNRFQGRFESMEASAEKPLQELTPAEWDQLWNQAKESQKGADLNP